MRYIRRPNQRLKKWLHMANTKFTIRKIQIRLNRLPNKSLSRSVCNVLLRTMWYHSNMLSRVLRDNMKVLRLRWLAYWAVEVEATFKEWDSKLSKISWSCATHNRSRSQCQLENSLRISQMWSFNQNNLSTSRKFINMSKEMNYLVLKVLLIS